jgi:putative spermidine/putrescine transport system permease protein
LKSHARDSLDFLDNTATTVPDMAKRQSLLVDAMPIESSRIYQALGSVQRSRRFRIASMLVPALVVVGVLFVGGLLVAIGQSVGYFPLIGKRHLTSSHYGALFHDLELRKSLALTFILASASTLISSAAGLALALALRDMARHSRLLIALLQVPIGVPHLVMAVALINVIAPSGLIARSVCAAGLIRTPLDFPVLVNDRYGSGIILAYVLKETPFIALMVLGVLVRLGDEYHSMARTLGASAWQRWRYVTLPTVAPALVSGALVVFAFVFGAFEIPYLLGRPYPAMLSVVAQRHFMNVDLTERPEAIAIAIVIAMIASLVAWIHMRLARTLTGVGRPTVF